MKTCFFFEHYTLLHVAFKNRQSGVSHLSKVEVKLPFLMAHLRRSMLSLFNNVLFSIVSTSYYYN